ncbi:MAG TPA: 6-phosphofructokinase [Eubacteriales bacterium]|nr:6-phosphofructokinase [Eubacteriales bacterium]
MEQLVGACIIGQSGGPTAVINASAYGVIDTAMKSSAITRVLGAAHGIKGIINDELYDLDKEDPKELELLLHTPSAFLGSCRYKLKNHEDDDTDYRRILEVFKKYNVRYFFYNGGNDSMDTCNKISKFMKSAGYPCMIIGVPKTIDNDLWGTDHCPGFPSAAKYVATSCMELYLDARVYDTKMICIVEIMGRHAGWLAASASVAKHLGYGPDLIYLPEVNFNVDRFLEDVTRIYRQTGECLVAVSEGIHDNNGTLIAEYGADTAPVDCFGHKQLGGLASTLVSMVKSRLGNIKIRGIEMSLLQRCAAHCASETDVKESYMVGKGAVELALSGVTDVMAALIRETDEDGNYRCVVRPIDLALAANTEKKVPRSWINADENGVTQEYLDYILPLIQGRLDNEFDNGMPRFAKIQKIKATV